MKETHREIRQQETCGEKETERNTHRKKAVRNIWIETK
jgi:hypothetical protein